MAFPKSRQPLGCFVHVWPAEQVVLWDISEQSIIRLRTGSSACLFLLVSPEEDVEAHAEAPHGEQQQEQKPLHIIDDRSQRVHKRVLGRLQHPAREVSRVSTQYRMLSCPEYCRRVYTASGQAGEIRGNCQRPQVGGMSRKRRVTMRSSLCQASSLRWWAGHSICTNP